MSTNTTKLDLDVVGVLLSLYATVQPLEEF